MRLFTSLLFGAALLGCGDKQEDTGTDSTTDTTTDTSAESDSGDSSSGEDTSNSTGDTPEELGKALYEANCASCHGDDATGVSAPSLRNVR